MYFNSIDFAIFLPIVFILYWSVSARHLNIQNTLIVFASYVFYGWWDWRFLSLIVASTLVDYFVGLALGKEKKQSKRKFLLWISIVVNIGILLFFKYFNFFLDSFIDTFSFFGADIHVNSLSLILPIGISFYTFQTLSYSIDVYRKKIQPTRNFIAFSAFVCFFPQLVAGPIERAKNLLPQFCVKRQFDYNLALDGVGQILWGLFKKMVIADNCALIVKQIFEHSADVSGSTLVLGAVLFSFQIYCDFSGYSDVAIGTSRLFGFNLKQNFSFPYFSRDIAEFWRRWHISLTSWFRDYIYIPLGGSRVGSLKKVRNIFIIFIVSGFWHGANWTFIAWGTLNAIFFLPLLLLKRNRRNVDVVASGRLFPSIQDSVHILITFGLVTFSWIFFRAESIPEALIYINGIFNASLFSVPYVFGIGIQKALLTIIFIVVMLIIEWAGREKQHALAIPSAQPKVIITYSKFYVLAMAIFLFKGQSQEFIYFQF